MDIFNIASREIYNTLFKENNFLLSVSKVCEIFSERYWQWHFTMTSICYVYNYNFKKIILFCFVQIYLSYFTEY